MTRGEKKQLRAGLAFTSLWILGLGAFTAYPVIASLYYSFCDYSILKGPVWSGVENYQQLVQDGLFWKLPYKCVQGHTPLLYRRLCTPFWSRVHLKKKI